MESRVALLFLLLTVSPTGILAQTTPWVQIQSPDTLATLEIASTPSGQLFARSLWSFNGEPRLFTSTNNGDTWSRVTNDSLVANQSPSSLLIDSVGVLYLSYPFIGIARSTNSGGSWVLLTSLLAVDRLVDNPWNHTIMAVVGSTLRSSADSCVTWGISATSMSHLLADRSGNLFGVDHQNLIQRSLNQGMNWFQSNIGMGGSGVQVLTCDNVGRLYAGTYGGGVYRSTSSGASWTPANVGLIGSDIRSIVTSPTAAVFAGVMGVGVCLSTDTGDSWSAINDGLSNPLVTHLFLTPNGALLASTSDGRMYRTIQPLITNAEAPSFPHTIALHQNYPNPFNPSTMIVFETSALGRAELVIHDLLGRQMQSFSFQDLAPGRHAQPIDGSQLSSGIYFYTLRFNKQNELMPESVVTRSMVLVR